MLCNFQDFMTLQYVFLWIIMKFAKWAQSIATMDISHSVPQISDRLLALKRYNANNEKAHKLHKKIYAKGIKLAERVDSEISDQGLAIILPWYCYSMQPSSQAGRPFCSRSRQSELSEIKFRKVVLTNGQNPVWKKCCEESKKGTSRGASSWCSWCTLGGYELWFWWYGLKSQGTHMANFIKWLLRAMVMWVESIL